MESQLYTKSWICHCIMMFSRVAYPILGIAYWQKAYKGRHEYEGINQEFVTQTEPFVKMFIILFIPLGIILDVMVWRCRSRANWIFYYELVSTLAQGLVPMNYGEFQLLFWFMFYF